jgi:tripartite-type tricarboxylate transporter receptor subunit TctC
VRIIVPVPPGGALDILARLTGQWLSDHLGQPFVIENRPGGGTNIGVEAVVRAPADGYTLLLIPGSVTANATLYQHLTFDFIRDIVPIAMISSLPLVMIVNTSNPAKTVPEFIAWAKANPGKVSMASGGTGSTSHIGGELLKLMTGIDMLHVPYRGGAPAITDLMGGTVQVYFSPLPDDLEHQGWQAPRAGGDNGQALGGAARRADDWRIRPGLRSQYLARHRSAQEYAGRDRRAAQQGDQRGARRPHHQGAPR